MSFGATLILMNVMLAPEYSPKHRGKPVLGESRPPPSTDKNSQGLISPLEAVAYDCCLQSLVLYGTHLTFTSVGDTGQYRQGPPTWSNHNGVFHATPIVQNYIAIWQHAQTLVCRAPPGGRRAVSVPRHPRRDRGEDPEAVSARPAQPGLFTGSKREKQLSQQQKHQRDAPSAHWASRGFIQTST